MMQCKANRRSNGRDVGRMVAIMMDLKYLTSRHAHCFWLLVFFTTKSFASTDKESVRKKGQKKSFFLKKEILFLKNDCYYEWKKYTDIFL